ncbi:hypothetical protein CERZMDRAFT_121383 [Cercospora zeae-maydis SCOH1-5]|uniref:Uncharacterized protein n=1 Tax=Cercospora zeae-maydis SCOH1-5 TaxID=717836 RepID=A0A6A6FE70_9PEZI|nr:hypothetical protein CERZMDRAFT_121383 [Cercospora zeae-maydis SCOH1-5]
MDRRTHLYHSKAMNAEHLHPRFCSSSHQSCQPFSIASRQMLTQHNPTRQFLAAKSPWYEIS